MAKTVVRDDITIPLGLASYGTIDEHYDAINGCQKCPLGKTRTKFVYGVGSPKAKLLFIGEAPGAQEDQQGEPFVGAAGKLLDKILAAIQLSRQEIYIANILKCRPPNNRDPQPNEVAECLPYLHEQIRIIQPKLICCLGRIAVQSLLQTTTPLSKLRKSWLDYHGIPMLVTYHPAALLRFPEYKKETWEDMKMLKARYDQL
ncbi:MAG: uracil-DNA glycosylase [bacterium]|nr:uracil-DNA glycosylase [bacterium]